MILLFETTTISDLSTLFKCIIDYYIYKLIIIKVYFIYMCIFTERVHVL